MTLEVIMANIDAKYEVWKNKLLDLGKRNRLLNYRDTARSNVKIEYPECGALYNMFVKEENALVFPFRYPMKLDTLILGGMLSTKCTWSLIIWPSRISTPLYRHNVLMISCKLSLYWLYITFRLYFGENTMWYLQIHFVCARLFVLLAIKSPSLQTM